MLEDKEEENDDQDDASMVKQASYTSLKNQDVREKNVTDENANQCDSRDDEELNAVVFVEPE